MSGRLDIEQSQQLLCRGQTSRPTGGSGSGRTSRSQRSKVWSQTNVFTDKGFKDGKGATKELSDTLVIFGTRRFEWSSKAGTTVNLDQCLHLRL
ncbi:MAG: hypothetical protein ABI216_13850 [Devosia sp.]